MLVLRWCNIRPNGTFSSFMPTIMEELKHEKYLSMFQTKIC